MTLIKKYKRLNKVFLKKLVKHLKDFHVKLTHQKFIFFKKIKSMWMNVVYIGPWSISTSIWYWVGPAWTLVTSFTFSRYIPNQSTLHICMKSPPHAPSPNYSLILLCFSLTSQNHNITISIIYWNNKRAFVWLYEGWSTVLFFFKKKEIYLVHLLFIFWKYNIKFIIADLHFIFIKNINHKRPLITIYKKKGHS